MSFPRSSWRAETWDFSTSLLLLGSKFSSLAHSRAFPDTERKGLREEGRTMFYHGFSINPVHPWHHSRRRTTNCEGDGESLTWSTSSSKFDYQDERLGRLRVRWLREGMLCVVCWIRTQEGLTSLGVGYCLLQGKRKCIAAWTNQNLKIKILKENLAYKTSFTFKNYELHKL